MVYLLDLPYEVLTCIIDQVEPTALASLAGTCKTLHSFIESNPLLYKDIYLSLWDNPMHKRHPTSNKWKEDVQNYVKLGKILASRNEQEKRRQFQFVGDCVTDLIQSASQHYGSNNIAALKRLFSERQNQHIYMCDSNLFARARRDSPNLRSLEGRRHMSAKLHCLHGNPVEDASIESGPSIYPFACSKVYDLRNYTERTKWGPFKRDGSGDVDWEMVEAVMIVLAHNLRQCRVFHHHFILPIWNVPFAGVVANSHILKEGIHHLPSLSSELEDCYGINGTWMRVVCFLDFTELFAYNFTSPSLPHGSPRPPLNTDEAIRMIVMHIKITRIEEPGPNDGQALPVVHFGGKSRPRYAHWDANASAHVKGSVRLTKEGEVHWTTFSVYNGEERWRSESIQVGGIRSARGCVGNWFDKDYDRHGPIGPTAFWKLSNDINAENSDEED